MRSWVRGQISMEYIMVTGAMLLVLTLLIIIFNGLYGQQALNAQYMQARHNVLALKAEATDVWAQGKGARSQVVLDIPPSANLTASLFSTNLIDLNLLGFGDVTAATTFPLNGTWPNQTGSWVAGLYNNGTHVLIRPAGRLSINVSGFYITQAFSTSNTSHIQFHNQAASGYTLEQTISCPATITCSYTASGTNILASDGILLANLTTNSSSTTGLVTGYLNVTATPDGGSGLPEETFILPITVQVY